MRGYEDYEDLDEYEEEGDEYEDEEGGEEGQEEEEEPRKPTREELEYLELRQRLKEKVRKQWKKDSGSALSNGRDKKNKLPNDNYGSFFGPSQPVIAQRVIQESKSLLENPHLAARVSKSNNGSSKTVSSAPGGSRPQPTNHPQKVPAVVRAKSKVQILKNTRDYSFLLSDDTELPASTKPPPPRNVSVPRTEAHSAQVSQKSKEPSSSDRKKVVNVRDERRPLHRSSQVQPKPAPHRLDSSSKPISRSVDPRKQLGSNNGSGPGRPSVPTSRPSATAARPSVQTSRPAVQTARASLSKGLPSKKPSLPSKSPTTATEKKINAPVQKSHSSMSGVRKPPPKLQASGSNRPLDRRREAQEPNKGKIISKQSAPSSSRPQTKQPVSKNPPRAAFQENRQKKRPVRQYSDEEDDDDGGAAISLIRNMFGYNPNKYRDDDDDSDMEANFDDIMREEHRSAKIARKEDEEELRKIEEEERRERMRREAKKRKLSR